MSYENILLKIIKIGLILVFLTPLVLGPFGLTFSAYPKTVYFRSLVEFIFIFYFLLIYFYPKKYLPKVSPLLLAVSFFILILFLASLFGVNFYRSFFGDLNRNEGLILHLHLFLFFIILISVFNKKEAWFNLFKITVIVSAISSFVGILQKLGFTYFYSFYGISPTHRITGTLANPDFFGAFLTLTIYLGIFVFFAEKKRIFKIIWLLILGLNSYTLILSQTKAALLGAAAGIIFLALFWFFLYSKASPRSKKAVFLIIPIVLFLLLLIISNNEGIIPVAVFSRFSEWEVALKAFGERPILGWGPESFGYVFDKFFEARYLERIPENVFSDYAHNKVFDLLVAAGILGLLSYISIFLISFYLIFKYNNSFYGLILASLLIAYFIQNLFTFDTISSYLVFFLVLGFINNNFKKDKIENYSKEFSSIDKSPNQFLSKPFFQQFIDIFTILSFIFFILAVFYQINFKPTKTSLIVIEGVKTEQKDINQTLDYYKKGINQKTIYDLDFKIQVTERLLDIFHQEWTTEGRVEMAGILLNLRPFFEEKLETRDKISRNFYKINYGINEKLYSVSNNPVYLEAAERIIKRALEFNNQRPEFHRLLGRIKILKKDYPEGEALFEEGYELTPKKIEDKIIFYRNLGGAYFIANEPLKAVENLKKGFDLRYWKQKFDQPLANNQEALLVDELARLYFSLGDSETAQDIYEKAIEIFSEKYKAVFRSRLEILEKQKQI